MLGTPTFIIVASPAGAQQLQAWLNTIGGASVLTEAVTLTDSTGTEKTAANPLAVSEPEKLDLILAELRVISYLLTVGLNVTDNLDNIRNDLTLTS
jgi:hypothetical protein